MQIMVINPEIVTGKQWVFFHKKQIHDNYFPIFGHVKSGKKNIDNKKFKQNFTAKVQKLKIYLQNIKLIRLRF